ncbi:c-type cytochrome [Paraburkholderia bannensis]|uniref:c-type cytochrome n=1 Tax=Paraburkholderia bannensis TaxID=765414 RepID=UPI002AC35B73|nr:cytochrome c [Paraburkholderia bannensis]
MSTLCRILPHISRGVALIASTSGVLFCMPCAHAIGKGDAAQGRTKFTACISCHGADGRTPTSPGFPKIGGQNADYLAAALHAYKSGQRNGGMSSMMQSMAKPLNDQDIDNLAAYIATLDAQK